MQVQMLAPFHAKFPDPLATRLQRLFTGSNSMRFPLSFLRYHALNDEP